VKLGPHRLDVEIETQLTQPLPVATRPRAMLDRFENDGVAVQADADLASPLGKPDRLERPFLKSFARAFFCVFAMKLPSKVDIDRYMP
jgi:hypothetical protein